MRLPSVYAKVLDIIQETNTKDRALAEEEVVRRFRLNKDDCRLIMEELDKKGLIKYNRQTLRFK